jgi:hypothetical protein
VENQTGKKIKVLRSDNGGEYASTEFVDFCSQAGIKRQMTIPYNPQQNRVVERKNRAITGAARSMLHDQTLSLYLWVETSVDALYLQNRSPHKILGRKTPEEAFTGRRPNVEHIRIFGCLTYSHVPFEKRTKLDPTAQQGIQVGYSEVSKAYRIYIPSQQRVVVSRDVRFEEGRGFRRSLESRDSIEEVPETQIDVSEGAQPQVSSTPFSGVTRSPCTASGSQLERVQAKGAETSRSQSVGMRSEIETRGRGYLTSPLVTTRKRKPRWFQETLKEAKENVGQPRGLFRENRAPYRLGSYLAMVMNITDTEPETFV